MRIIKAMAAVTKSVKLPVELARALEQQARQSGQSESDLIREGIALVIEDGGGLDMQRLIGTDVGVGSGPPGLSQDRRFLAGYGSSRDR
jgi:hypothetical protein